MTLVGEKEVGLFGRAADADNVVAGVFQKQVDEVASRKRIASNNDDFAR